MRFFFFFFFFFFFLSLFLFFSFSLFLFFSFSLFLFFSFSLFLFFSFSLFLFFSFSLSLFLTSFPPSIQKVVLEGNKRVVAWVYICQIDVNEGKKLKDDVADWKLYMREGGYRDEVDPFRPSSSCSSSSSSSGDE